MFKTTYTGERSDLESCDIQLDRKEIKINFKRIIQILQSIVIDYFRRIRKYLTFNFRFIYNALKTPK